jgi:starch synthase
MSPRIVFAASEVFPLVKTGGLADVAANLPAALMQHGADVRIAVPAYRGWRTQLTQPREFAVVDAAGHRFNVWQARHPQIGAPLWLFDNAVLFDRPGNPYHDDALQPWQDNGLRFGAFADALAQLVAAPGRSGLDADILHGNDWQTGLAMGWLRERGARAAGVFTIHNLAYQGIGPASLRQQLALPEAWWHLEGVEFHGALSQLKAGIVYADAVTTVSPTYAAEIQQAEHGAGLDGLLRSRAHKLHGIVNGIDDALWDPRTDPHISHRYAVSDVVAGKQANRAALQQQLGLQADAQAVLVGMVTRFAQQKGVDLLLAALPRLLQLPLQFAILGSGDRSDAENLLRVAAAHPQRFAVHVGHDEDLAHRIVAGADLFLMPSRYEPCGLTQMYAQRYGTIPVVRRTGGLADTVTDVDAAPVSGPQATGVHFVHADAGGVLYGIRRALELRSVPGRWQALQRAGMARDFSWRQVAADYLALYRGLLRR